jgi:hypothetical protein
LSLGDIDGISEASFDNDVEDSILMQKLLMEKFCLPINQDVGKSQGRIILFLNFS